MVAETALGAPRTAAPGAQRGESAAAREGCPVSTAPWAQPAGLHVGRAAGRLVEGERKRVWQSPDFPKPKDPKPLKARPIGQRLSRRSLRHGVRARRRYASTAPPSTAPSTSTRSMTRCAASVPRRAGVTPGALHITPADEPHTDQHSRVPQVVTSSSRTGLSRARRSQYCTSMARESKERADFHIYYRG